MVDSTAKKFPSALHFKLPQYLYPNVLIEKKNNIISLDELSKREEEKKDDKINCYW